MTSKVPQARPRRRTVRPERRPCRAGPPKAGKRNTRRRSGEIMEAAARVFAERGYHGASTQDIADLLGIRQASLYYYFPSKEVALEHVCMQGVAGFFETEQAIAAGPGNAAREAGRPDPRAYRAAARPQPFRARVPHPAPVPAEPEPAADRQVLARHRGDLRVGDPRRASARASSAPTPIRAFPRWRSSACATRLPPGTARKTPRSSASAANLSHWRCRGFVVRTPKVRRALTVLSFQLRYRILTPAGAIENRNRMMGGTGAVSRDALRRTTAPALLCERARSTPDDVAFRSKHLGLYRERTFRDYALLVSQTAQAFAALGVTKGERVAIMGDVCEEWLICDLAAQSLGAIVYGIYPTARADRSRVPDARRRRRDLHRGGPGVRRQDPAADRSAAGRARHRHHRCVGDVRLRASEADELQDAGRRAEGRSRLARGARRRDQARGSRPSSSTPRARPAIRRAR